MNLKWLTDHIPEWVTAVSTVVYAFYTYKMMKTNQNLLLETHRPNIVACIVEREQMYYIKFENIGNKTAEKVLIKDTNEITFGIQHPELVTLIKQFYGNCHYIVPQQAICCCLGACEQLSELKDKVIEFNIEYRYGNRSFNDKAMIDVKSYYSLSDMDKVIQDDIYAANIEHMIQTLKNGV